MSRRSRRTAAPGTMQERGETKIERHRKKPKGWRGDYSKHSQAAKRGWPRRRYNQSKKAAMTPPSPPKKRELTEAAKRVGPRRRRKMPDKEEEQSR